MRKTKLARKWLNRARIEQMVVESSPKYKVENSAATKKADAVLDILGRQMELNPTKSLSIDEAKAMVGNE